MDNTILFASICMRKIIRIQRVKVDNIFILINTIAIGLSIFLYDPGFRSSSFGFYSTCILVFWLPTLDKFD